MVIEIDKSRCTAKRTSVLALISRTESQRHANMSIAAAATTTTITTTSDGQIINQISVPNHNTLNEKI